MVLLYVYTYYSCTSAVLLFVPVVSGILLVYQESFTMLPKHRATMLLAYGMYDKQYQVNAALCAIMQINVKSGSRR